MSAIFISHSSHDNRIAQRIKDWLSDLGFENVFLDFDDAQGIMPGERWERRLYDEISRCQAVVLVHTPAWLGSRWCFVEFTQARALGKPIFPVIVTPFDGMVIASDLQAIDLSDWDQGGRERLSRSLMSIAGQIARGFRWDRSRPPFPGIDAFEPEDAPVFFGRDEETREIVAMLESRRVQGGDRFVLVLGASGSGKSSVVKGGVVPVLRREAASWSVLPPVRPQTAPLLALARAVAAALPDDGAGVSERARALAEDPRGAAVRLAADLGGDGPIPRHVLVPIDQIEEVLSCGAAERDRFVQVLWEMANPASELPFVLLATCRTDASDAVLALAQLRALAVSLHPLKPMPLSRLPQLVEGPAAVASVGVEQALVRRIVADVPDAEILPLFAFTMRELYERFASRSRQLRLADYLALGDAAAGVTGIENAVRQRADDVIRSFHPDDAETAALRSAFIPGLVRIDAEGRAFRRTARLADLPPGAGRMLRAFVEARLLASTADEGGSLVEVAHEALFRVWPTLAAWIAGERDFLHLFQQVEAQREIWLRAPEAERGEALLQGLSLSRAKPVFEADPERFGPAADYVRDSLARDDERRRERRAQHEAVLISQSRMLARSADECLREGNTGTAIQLALAALPSDRTPRPLLAEARVVLQAGVEAHREIARITHGEPVHNAWFSTDGRSILSFGANEDHVRISALDGRLLSTIPVGKGARPPLPVGDGGVLSIRRDSRRSAVPDVASVWTERGRCLGQFDLRAGDHIECSPDAGWVVRTAEDTLSVLGMGGLERFSHRITDAGHLGDSASSGGRSYDPSLLHTCISGDSRRGATTIAWTRALFCWSADGSHAELLEFSREVEGAAFAPDGRLWCVDAAGTLTILDADWSPFARVEGLCRDVRMAFFTFSPDGALCSLKIDTPEGVSSAFLLDRDGVLLRRDLRTSVRFGPDGTLVSREGDAVRIEGRDGALLASFTPKIDGALVVDPAVRALVVWSGRVAQVWDFEGALVAQVAHDAALSSAQVSRDARLALTCGEDGTVRLWDLAPRRPVRVTCPAEPRVLRFLGAEPLLLVVDGEERMRVVDAGGQPVADGHGLWADQARFRDSRHLADASGRFVLGLARDGGRLRDLRSGREQLLRAERPWGARFSPAGDRVLLWADHDADLGVPGSVHVWSVDGAKLGTVEQPRVTEATFTPEGHVAVVGGRTASLWDGELTLVAELTCETGFEDEGLSHDGRFLTARPPPAEDGSVSFTVFDWSPRTRATFERGRGSYKCDGRFIVAFDRGQDTCDVFDFDGRRLASSSRCFFLEGFRSSPDSTRFTLKTSRTAAVLHDGADGRPIAELRHPAWLRAVAFSRDGSSIVTSDLDGGVFCWDRDGRMLARIDVGTAVDLAAVSEDGRYLALKTDKETVEIRPGATPLDRLVGRARTLVPHDLTAAQRLRYDL